MNKQELGKSSFKKGFWGEIKALFFIIIKGYIPLRLRYRAKTGEIDIIARKKNTLIFIEVKSRPTVEQGFYSISHKQKQRIKQTAIFFCRKHLQYRNCGFRFDAIVILPRKWPVHLIDVW